MGAVGFYIDILWVLFMTADIAYSSIQYSGSTLQLILYAPEASCGKDGFLFSHNAFFIIGMSFTCPFRPEGSGDQWA